MDGREQMKMASGEEVTWMNVADKASGSDLFVHLIPLEQGGHNWRAGVIANVQPGFRALNTQIYVGPQFKGMDFIVKDNIKFYNFVKKYF